MTYDVFKIIHLLGVIILLGNVTVTSFWKLFADRSGEARLIAHAQYLVTVTDWFFTLSGIVLLVGGGFGACWAAGIDPFGAPWLVKTEILFLAAGVIWLGLLVPIQIRQARAVRGFIEGAPIPGEYRRLSRIWLIWGIIATVPLIAALYFMVAK